MKLSEILKDKSIVIESIQETRFYTRHIDGGLFRKSKDEINDRVWYGYAIVKNGKRLLETFGYWVDEGEPIYNWSLIINGQKQAAESEIAREIYLDVENQYKEQEDEKRRIKAEKQKAILEQKKQVFYDMLQKNLLVK